MEMGGGIFKIVQSGAPYYSKPNQARTCRGNWGIAQNEIFCMALPPNGIRNPETYIGK